MLSPGERYKQVPKGRRENLEFRAWLLKRGRANRRVRDGLKEVCARDILFYVNAFVWAYDPRAADKVQPFITWPVQDSVLNSQDRQEPGILWCVENKQDLLFEKSKDMGLSWLCLIAQEWMWHFHPWMKFLCVSKSEKAVEDDDPDSLFWKIDFIHRFQPEWLHPPGMARKRRRLYFGNDLDSSITGVASTGDAGVGGRATAMFVDEFSIIKEDHMILHHSTDTADCRIFNGTHRGTATAFYELSRRPDMKKRVVHWTQHPGKVRGLYRAALVNGVPDVVDKTYPFPPDFDFVLDGTPAGGPRPGVRSPWYDEQCRRKGSARAAAMDLDINPEGTVAQFFDPRRIRELKAAYCRPCDWEGELNHEKKDGTPDAFFERPGGYLRLWFRPRYDGRPPYGEYAAGADVAQGTGRTNSCLSILDVRTGEKVAEYACPVIMPHEFATLAVALCRFFRSADHEGARLIWENAGPTGTVFGRKVVELGYRRFYMHASDYSMFNKLGDRPGFVMNNQSKGVLLADYRTALWAGEFLNRSQEALDECLKFYHTPRGDVKNAEEENTEDPSGARANHGDRVIADALAWKMARGKGATGPRQEQQGTPVGSFAWRRELAAREHQAADSW